METWCPKWWQKVTSKMSWWYWVIEMILALGDRSGIIIIQLGLSTKANLPGMSRKHSKGQKLIPGIGFTQCKVILLQKRPLVSAWVTWVIRWASKKTSRLAHETDNHSNHCWEEHAHPLNLFRSLFLSCSFYHKRSQNVTIQSVPYQIAVYNNRLTGLRMFRHHSH